MPIVYGEIRRTIGTGENENFFAERSCLPDETLEVFKVGDQVVVIKEELLLAFLHVLALTGYEVEDDGTVVSPEKL